MSTLTTAKYSIRNGSLRSFRAATEGGVNMAAPSTAEVLTQGIHHSAEYFSAMFQGAIAVFGLALGAIFEFKIAKNDHDKEEERLTDLYRNEIAMQTGVPPRRVTVQQLKVAATRNPVLAEALATNDKKIKSKMRSWLGCSLVAGAVIFALFSPLPVLLGLTTGMLAHVGLGLTAGGIITGWPTLAMLAAKIAISVGAFQAAKPLMDRIANRVTGIAPTTHDYIAQLGKERSQGRQLMPEQVLGVFVKANPSLGADIKARTGKSYEQLLDKEDVPTLRALELEYEPHFHLIDVTHRINSGLTAPTELAYLATQRPDALLQQSSITLSQPDAPEPGRTSFVERLATERSNPGLSRV